MCYNARTKFRGVEGPSSLCLHSKSLARTLERCPVDVLKKLALVLQVANSNGSWLSPLSGYD
eukprot:2149287-Amphidinium_carterae.1